MRVDTLSGMQLFDQQITAIEPQPRNEKLAAIKVEGKRVAVLSLAAIARLGLQVGSAWDAQLAQRIADEQAYEAVLHQATRWLDRKMLSVTEVRSKLAARNVPAEVCDHVIQRLEQLGLLDEAALGRLVIDQVRARGAAGPVLLRDRLLKRGLNETLADELLAQQKDQNDPTDTSFQEALTLAQKKQRSMAGLDTPTQRRRLAGVLARRGYDEETVLSVLEYVGLV